MAEAFREVWAPAAPQEEDEAEIGRSISPVLLEYWQAIVRWRMVIAAIVGLCLVAGIVMTLLTSPLYTARTQIEISREQKNVTNVESVESPQEGQDTEFYETQYSLLKADSLAERVARKLNLAQSQAFFAAHARAFPPGVRR